MKGAFSKYLGLGMLVVAALAMPTFAQAGGGGGGGGGFGGGGGGGGRGGRGGGGNPAQFQQQRMDQIKQQIGAKDDEWAAIQPALEKVMNAQRDVQAGARGGMMGGGGRRGNQGGGATPAAGTSELAKAIAELQAALQNPDTPPEQIKAKLQAVRDARAKAKDALVKAQKELQALLTQRQEAVFVEMGILE
jgi:hypothetical protein